MTAGPPPANLRLTLTPGGSGQDTVLSLRVFNQAARDARQRRQSATVTRLGVSAAEWTTKVAFLVESQGAERTIPASALRVIRAPQSADLVVGGQDLHEIVYAVSAASMPAAGAEIRAVMTVQNRRIESNRAAVPQPAPSRFDELRRQAVAAQAVGNNDRLLGAGEALITLDPDQTWGYWYKGLALEAAGREADALQAYETMLLKMPAGPVQERPVLLYRRIRDLQRKLGVR